MSEKEETKILCPKCREGKMWKEVIIEEAGDWKKTVYSCDKCEYSYPIGEPILK